MKNASSAKRRVSTNMTRQRLEMPNGSGALVLFAKSDGKLKVIEVTPLKNVSSERGRNEIWTIVENTVAPQRLSLELGPCKTIWSDLERFRVYRDWVSSQEQCVESSSKMKIR